MATSLHVQTTSSSLLTSTTSQTHSSTTSSLITETTPEEQSFWLQQSPIPIFNNAIFIAIIGALAIAMILCIAHRVVASKNKKKVKQTSQQDIPLQQR